VNTTILINQINGELFSLGKNRDKISIIGAILKAAGSGATKTRIMTQANLSFSLLEKYLNVVTNAGFLQLIDYKYVVTDRGTQFLKDYQRFSERYDKAQRVMESLDTEREKLAKLCRECGLPSNTFKPLIDIGKIDYGNY
jgi:predicted transcriptional regulator